MTKSFRFTSVLFTLVALALVVYAPDALACPNCVDPTAKSAKAFGYTTLVLSVIPVGFFGAIVWWLWQQAKKNTSSSTNAP